MDMDSVVDHIIQKGYSVKIDDGDYINDDGLICCGKCHTPKQTKVVFQGKVFTPACLCDCALRKLKAEEAERKRVEHLRRVEELREDGLPDALIRNWNFSNDDGGNAKVLSVARRYVENFPAMYERGKGLLFYGTVGTGKSFASACIANALIEQERPCYFTSLSKIVNTVMGSAGDKQSFIEDLNRYHLLIIDDLASERDTEYMNEMVQNVIDTRYISQKPLIITTNLTADELKHPMDLKRQRLYSRLLEMCIPVEVKGKDRRKEKLKADYGDLEKLLGLGDKDACSN